MALLAESLVDEWLNRQRFFTIRGVKQNLDEIDLLAVRPEVSGEILAWHIEVQVSFRPVNYMTPLTDALERKLGKRRTSAVRRSPEQVDECTGAWMEKKFKNTKKVRLRDSIWPGLNWQYVVVHGVVKHNQELESISQHGAKVVPLSRVLADLCADGFSLYTGASGGDLADLIRYYAETSNGQT
ncbi:MAG TPA: hypothetical protein VFA07_19825 [Chthonomonadaceae bacterium]|nr:hypothetical protein [Chthonomonadaceae bacterium]